MPKHLCKVMNRCPRCQTRGFTVQAVGADRSVGLKYELSCTCGHVMTIPRNEVRLAVISSNGYIVGFHHWTRGDVLLASNSKINWEAIPVV